MRGRFVTTLACFGLLALAYCIDHHPVLTEIQHHLDLARRCASAGQVEGALAHAFLVTPDKPLRVRVDCSNVPASSQGLYRNALRGAFSMWEEALGQRVFVLAETGKSDIVIHFKADVNDNGVEVCGHSDWTRGVINGDSNPVAILTAEVQVRMFKPNGDPLTYDQLSACAAHELGHVLGLDDSVDGGGLMGRMDFNHPITSIKPNEVESLLRARQEAVQIRRELQPRPSKSNQ